MKRVSAFASVTLLLAGLCVVASAAKDPPSHKIDINAASAKELEELPGVGPATANAIVQFRAKSGRFRRVEDLLAIRGISETKLDKMRPYIVVGPPPAPAPPVKKAAPASPAAAQSNH
jgi:comEA protein